MAVDDARGDLLARSALAGNEHRRIDFGRLAQLLQHSKEAGIGADAIVAGVVLDGDRGLR